MNQGRAVCGTYGATRFMQFCVHVAVIRCVGMTQRFFTTLRHIYLDNTNIVL